MQMIPAKIVRVLESAVTIEPEMMERLRHSRTDEDYKKHQFEVGARAMAQMIIENPEVVEFIEERPHKPGCKTSALDQFVLRWRITLIPAIGGEWPFHKALEQEKKSGMAHAAVIVQHYATRVRDAGKYGPLQAMTLDRAARLILAEMNREAPGDDPNPSGPTTN